jgi:hypothetical protein
MGAASPNKTFWVSACALATKPSALIEATAIKDNRVFIAESPDVFVISTISCLSIYVLDPGSVTEINDAARGQ